MFWLISRIILYIIIFTGIWYGGQIYITQELAKDLQEPSPHVIFVDQNILSDEVRAKMQTGSQNYPFATIAQGLTATTERNITTVIVKNGVYNEIITVPNNIILYGDGVVTIAQPTQPHIKTVVVGNNTALINFHISGGNKAVVIPHNTATRFFNTTISDAYDFGIVMNKKERPKIQPGKPLPLIYDIYKKTEEEINTLPLVRISKSKIINNDNQGLYLFDGRVEIVDSLVKGNGEEGIDLHSHMYVTIDNVIAQQNGESGLETEVYDNIIKITNSTFKSNYRSGIAFLTSIGTGDITITDSFFTNNAAYGMRCAVHKDRPTYPRPFFQSTIHWKNNNNTFENNARRNIAPTCYQF